MRSLFVRAAQFRPGDANLGRSFAFDDADERAIKSSHYDAIQTFANRSVSPDDVHIRGMLLTNTQRDFYYSRFTREALEEQTDLIPGAPVMAGHDYSRLPDARFFASRVIRIEDASLPKRDQYWTENLYYVPRDAEGDAYVRRVDLGVFKEVSIGFRLASTPCSVCKKAIWACEHIPGEVYDRAGICEWGMEGITSVLEGSQVFRGGQKDTTNFIPDGQSSNRIVSAFAPGGDDFDSRLLIAAKRANAEAIKSGMTLEEFLATDEASRATGLGAVFGKRGERSNTQSVVCNKSRFTDPRRAAKWVRDHDFRADKRSENDAAFVFEQFPESMIEPGSIRAIGLDDGVSARVCKVRQIETPAAGRSVDERSEANESFDSWLTREAESR